MVASLLFWVCPPLPHWSGGMLAIGWSSRWYYSWRAVVRSLGWERLSICLALFGRLSVCIPWMDSIHRPSFSPCEVVRPMCYWILWSNSALGFRYCSRCMRVRIVSYAPWIGKPLLQLQIRKRRALFYQASWNTVRDLQGTGAGWKSVLASRDILARIYKKVCMSFSVK